MHRAIVICGNCGTQTTIALGMASAIGCPKCKTEIQLGEMDIPENFSECSDDHKKSAHPALVEAAKNAIALGLEDE